MGRGDSSACLVTLCQLPGGCTCHCNTPPFPPPPHHHHHFKATDSHALTRACWGAHHCTLLYNFIPDLFTKCRNFSWKCLEMINRMWRKQQVWHYDVYVLSIGLSTEVSMPTNPKPLAARPNRANLLMASTMSHIPSASKGTLYLVLTID